jgi:DNA-directed RNA polymerase beta' subunit
MKNINGIYSSRFGQKLGDINPFADRYSCECGHLKSRINHDIECPMCHTKVKYVDDNFKLFGWIILKDNYHIIHPKFYDTLDYLFGESKYNEDRKKIKGSRKLKNILNYSPEVDQNGFSSECSFKPDKEPFFGLGMIDFYNRFDEIIDYYYELSPKKAKYYNEIQDYKYACSCRSLIGRDKIGQTCKHCGKPVKYIGKSMIFTHSIPVFTTHLRPADIKDGYMYFEPTNGMYNMINTHVHRINNDKRKMNRDIKVKNSELFEVQKNYMDLVNEIMDILSGKKGQIRNLISGRYNYSSRSVIRQDATLRVDQIKLPYVTLVKCLEQPIINILVRNYNISPSEAYEKWYRSIAKKDNRIAEIIDNIIKSHPEGGIPFLINRNPTINYGSILQVYCVGYTDTLTMSVPLQSIKSMAADFDGDVLNILMLINGAFTERCKQIFNPRNAMYISRIDGKLNSDLLVQRDTLINTNTFLYLGRNNYNEAQLAKIKAAKERQREYFKSDLK